MIRNGNGHARAVRLSNLQLAVLDAFGAQRRMTLDEFSKFDQRITSSLGPTKRRVKAPYVVKGDSDHVTLTLEGRAALRLYHAADVFRKSENYGLPLAHCFDRVNRRAAVTDITRRHVA